MASWLTSWWRSSCPELRRDLLEPSEPVSISSPLPGAAFCKRLPENLRRPSASKAGARPEDGAAADISDMALTDGKVGYMLPIDDLDVGETPLEE